MGEPTLEVGPVTVVPVRPGVAPLTTPTGHTVVVPPTVRERFAAPLPEYDYQPGYPSRAERAAMPGNGLENPTWEFNDPGNEFRRFLVSYVADKFGGNAGPQRTEAATRTAATMLKHPDRFPTYLEALKAYREGKFQEHIKTYGSTNALGQPKGTHPVPPKDFTDYTPSYEVGLSEQAYAGRRDGGLRPQTVASAIPYQTALTPDQEIAFRHWVVDSKVPFDPGPRADYDMRGFWLARQGGDPRATQAGNGHFPDTWKTPHHATFSDESVYATHDAPRWEGSRLVDRAGRVLADESVRSEPVPVRSEPAPPAPLRSEPLGTPVPLLGGR